MKNLKIFLGSLKYTTGIDFDSTTEFFVWRMRFIKRAVDFKN
jgi:hypothetical protein